MISPALFMFDSSLNACSSMMANSTAFCTSGRASAPWCTPCVSPNSYSFIYSIEILRDDEIPNETYQYFFIFSQISEIPFFWTRIPEVCSQPFDSLYNTFVSCSPSSVTACRAFLISSRYLTNASLFSAPSAFILLSFRSTDHSVSPKIILCVEMYLSVALAYPWSAFPRISPVPVRVHSLERAQASAPAHTPTSTRTASTRAAQYLNSGISPIGSRTGFVSAFAAASA